ncbi:MAG: FHA domain-containing protein [bacterium]
MPKLIVKRKAEVVRECDLKTSQASYSIGSERQNDLSIDDRLVSITHARIERTGNRFFIRDLKSAFGTFVNGERIEDISELKDGDQIQLGDHTIVFDNPLEKVGLSLLSDDESDPVNAQEPNLAEPTLEEQKRLDVLEDRVRKESLSLLRQSSFEKSDTIPYQLLAIYGPYQGKRYQLRHHETKIGRDENLNDIVLDKNRNGEPDQSISRRHAMIIHKDGSFFVADKRSKTRTYVNREVVPVDSEVELFPNDEVEVVSDQQSTIFRFVEEGSNDFKPPKRAGVWWVRYQSKFAAGLVTLAFLTGLFFMASGFIERAMLTQQPSPLSLELSYWSTDKSLTFQNDQFNASEQDRFFRLVPAVADFNGDGVLDIATTNITSKPILIDGATKLPRWIIDTMPASTSSPLVAADVNQNGLLDVIYLSHDGRLVAIDGKHGAEIWLSPFFNQKLTGPAVVDDFDGDGLNDVAIADVTGTVHVGYNQVISVEWTAISTGIPIRSPLTSSDLDGDGDSELICGSERGIVFLLDGANRNVLGTIDVNEVLNRALGTFYEDNQIRYPVGVADLNNDGRLDLVISTVQGRLVAIDGVTQQRLWHDILTGDLSLNTGSSFPFAVGDFDGDDHMDIVALSEQGEIRAYAGSGQDQHAQLLWRNQPDKPSAVQSFMVGDINKDQAAEVVFNDEDGVLWILDGKTGVNLNKSEQSSAILTSMPLAADLQNDGMLDIFSITHTGIVFQYKTNSLVPKGSVIWGQQFGQNQNTLHQAYELPRTLKADASMLVGLLIFLAGGTATFFIQKRRRF